MNASRKPYSIPERLAVVEARQSGLTLEEVVKMFNAGTTSVAEWTHAYEKGGLAGLEDSPRGSTKALNPKTEAAAKIIGELKAQAPEAGIGSMSATSRSSSSGRW